MNGPNRALDHQLEVIEIERVVDVASIRVTAVL